MLSKTISIIALCAVTLPAAGSVLLNEGFNATTLPAGWQRTTLANTGGDATPAVTFVASSSDPSATPYEDARFAKFNSYSTYPGTAIRLWYSNGFATVGYGKVKVRCAWYQYSGQYSQDGEGAWLRWSTNGIDWHSLTFFANNAGPSGWQTKDIELPTACLEQPRLRLAFEFIAQYGYNCYLDAVLVTGLAPNVYFTPALSHVQGAASTLAPHALLLENNTATDVVCMLSYTGAWGAIGPASVALAARQSSNILVYTAIPAGAADGALHTGSVTAVAVNGSFSNCAALLTECLWYDFTAPIFYEPFELWTNGWQTYQFASKLGNWVQYHNAGYDDNGPAPPCAFHTNVLTAMSTNWLVSPPIPTTSPMSGLMLSFFHGQLLSQWYRRTYVMISSGSAHPADGDYTKVFEIGRQLPVWYKQYVDISSFVAAPTMHLAFVYIGMGGHQQLIDSVDVVGHERRPSPGVDSLCLTLTDRVSVLCYEPSPLIGAELWVAGQTGGAAPLSNIFVEIGYGPRGSLPDDAWYWTPATYLGPAGSNDLYGTNLMLTISDAFDIACRARTHDGSWLYADRDGSTNGYLPQQAGTLDALMPPPRGALLYYQTITNDYAYGPGSFADPTNAPTLFVQSADDLTLAADAEIRSLRWAGLYWGDGRSGRERGFWLRIYASAGTMPGALLYQQYLPGYACERSAGGSRGVMDYHADLATPFFTRAFSTYWWSVQMDIDTYAMNTRWSIADTFDLVRGRPAAMSTNRVSWFARTIDLGVALYGEVTNAGFVAGTVLAGNAGAPLRNALIVVSNAWGVATARTSADGTYLLTAAQQVYNVHAAAARYQTALTTAVAVSAGATSRVDFVLWGSQLAWGATGLSAIVELGTVWTNWLSVTNSGPLAATLYLAAREPAAPAARPCYGLNIVRGQADVKELLLFDVTTPQTPTVVNANIGSEEPWGITFRNQDYSTLYGISFAKKLTRINTATGVETVIGPAVPGSGEYWSGIAADTNGELYATTSLGSTYSKLYTIDPDTGMVTPRAAMPGYYIADIAFTTQGQLYGVDITSDLLLRIDKETGAATAVGPLGFNAAYDSGLTFDPRNNQLYLASWDSDQTPRGRFYRVSTATGAATLIGTQEAGTLQIAGLAMPLSLPSAWARPAPDTTTIAPGIGAVRVLFDARTKPIGLYHATLSCNGSFVNTPPAVPLQMEVVPEPAHAAALLLAVLALRRRRQILSFHTTQTFD